MKAGQQVETPVGTLNVNPQEIEDGPVVVTIRPENLMLGREGENATSARILSHIYVGTHTRFKAQAGDWEFEIVADASSVEHFTDDQVLPLQFPREKIWLVPPEE